MKGGGNMSDKNTVYECKHCKMNFIKEDWEELGRLEEVLWGHIQMDHEELFEDIQDLDTPAMLEIVYDIRYE
jgi:hypothetical protein